MEELEGILEGIENVDMEQVQKAFMNDPSLRQSAMEMLKNPNLTSEFWRKTLHFPPQLLSKRLGSRYYCSRVLQTAHC